MLDQERMISVLTARSEKDAPDHDAMFSLRGGLRRLSLTALAERFRNETGKDPYTLDNDAA